MKNTFKKPAMHSKKIIAITAIIVLGMASCASMSIESVDWASLTGPARVRQYFSVNTTDVTVYANYKDGSRKEVTFFSTSHNRESTGTQTVTVNVLGQGTGTFQTEVMELLSIRIESPPSKRTYTVGERADLTGIKVIGSWRDMPDAEIPSYEISVSSFNSNTAGTDRPVTINYKGKTATFHVNVVAAVAAAPATTAPATTTPSTPSTTAPAQTDTAFNPAPNQPSPVGTWRRSYTGRDTSGRTYDDVETFTFNADGTGTWIPTGTLTYSITWIVSGNRLTIKRTNYSDVNLVYSISGNTLTYLQEGYSTTRALTRQ